jgi:hypothetical protein
MTATQAKFILRNEKASYPSIVEAAAWLCDQPEPRREDLMLCLKFGGLPAEFAGMKLHQQTGRARPRDGRSIYSTHEDWESYFQRKAQQAASMKRDKQLR